MTSPVLKVKRGALTNLPALQVGEPALTTDTFDFFIGIDGTIPNNKFFGSHRYWTKETASVGSSVKVVEGTTNGSNYIALKSPDNLAGDLTYTLPGTQGASGTILSNDGSGILSWSNSIINPSFSGITTFTDTTDSTSYSDGSVQIRGGLGVTKSVNIGGNLSVAGVSTFVGNVTFQGGTINLGDSNTDDIVVAGEFKSNLVPTDDATYNLGIAGKRWNNAIFSGIVTATTFVGSLTGVASTATRATTVDTTATSTNASYYPTFAANSTSTTGETIRVDADITYNPSTNTLTVPNAQHSAIKATDGTSAITISTGTGNVGISSNLTVTGNLYVLGQTTEVETTNLKVADSLIDLGLIQSGTTLIPPTSDLNIDIGILFNWYNGSAKKAAVYWNDSLQRVGIASDITESSGVLTANAYSDIEIKGLWINDCAGETQVISCTGSERFLNNITVDAGTF